MIRLSLADLADSPAGWDEELTTALAGYDAAVQVVQKRQARRLAPGSHAPDGSRPVYGMPNRRFTPGEGIR